MYGVFNFPVLIKHNMELLFVWVACLWLVVTTAPDTFAIEYESYITFSQGTLKGRVSESRTGRKYLEFLGIPYAAKPKRFQLPGPPPEWEGQRDATKFGHKCLQMNPKTGSVEGAEDCLFLNVYTRVYSNPGQTRLPVMVWIHGGSFIRGSGSDHNPAYFMDDDVILVTFNYRLGSLGFLTTLNKNLIPNLGMKDQVAALTWVKKNIHSFGGDASRVTLFGTDAGAASVSYHILSPMSNGLFQRAISQSGNALCPWAFVRNPNDFANEMGKFMNCSIANSFTIAACLKQANPKEMIIQQQKLVDWNPEAISFVPFGPVVEFVHQAIETGPVFLHEPPMKLLREGRFRKVPWLTGVNSADGLTLPAAAILSNKELLKEVDANWQVYAPLIFGYKDLAPNPQSVSQKIRDFYFGGNGGIIDHTVRENFTNALSDRNSFRCARNCALLYAKQSPVWIYYFTYKSNASILNSYGIRDLLGFQGVAHSDELQYLFKMKAFPEIKHNSSYFEFSQSLISLWVSFASEGRPGELWHGAEKWSPVPPNQINSQSTMKMYRIDDYTEVIEEPFQHRLAFWDKLRLLPPQSSAFPSISRNYHPDSNINGATIDTLVNKLLIALCVFWALNLSYSFVL